MQEQRFRFPTPPNPFNRSEAVENPKALYERTVNELARRFIYHEGDLNWLAVEKAIQQAQNNPVIAGMEAQHRDLEALHDLLQGIGAHERVNVNHQGAWQAALRRQKATHEGAPKPPETLTREEVAREFDAFEFKKNTEYYEQQALKHYGRLLEEYPDTRIELSQNISLERTDIEVLVIDIRTRIIERLQDESARKSELKKLDDELAAIIERLPKEQYGKKFELEEIYLLRRLIHNADTGHLASVSHGTPREDLRADRGSVDIVLTAAGDVYEFQLKTFRARAHEGARKIQADVHARAERNLKGSKTHLVVLKAEAVKETYEASLRQAGGTRHTLADKFAALEPISKGLNIEERERLLTLVGLTEAELAQEQIHFDKRQAERKTQEEELRRKREEEERRFAEVEARRQAEITAQETIEQDRLERIARHEREQREASEQKRLGEIAASAAKQRQREAKQVAEIKAREAEQEAEKAKVAKEIAKTEKETEKKWAQTKLDQLGKPDALIEQGFLAPEDRNKPIAILAAKKLLAAKYPNVKSLLKAFPSK